MEEKYPNLPIGWNGPDMVLYTEQLPGKYQVLSCGEANKEHICLHHNVKEYSCHFGGESFCGYKLGAAFSVDGVSIYPCETCLSILNKEMKGYLYDEDKNEYYDSSG